jgi:dTDP-D-glucose 4,6-dehydratase
MQAVLVTGGAGFIVANLMILARKSHLFYIFN